MTPDEYDAHVAAIVASAGAPTAEQLLIVSRAALLGARTDSDRP